METDHTHINTPTPTLTHPHPHPHPHPHSPIHTHTHTHTHTHPSTPTPTPTLTHLHPHPHPHPQSPIHTHTQIHTNTEKAQTQHMYRMSTRHSSSMEQDTSHKHHPKVIIHTSSVLVPNAISKYVSWCGAKSTTGLHPRCSPGQGSCQSPASQNPFMPH